MPEHPLPPSADRAPTHDERQGVAWWNALSEAKRLLWLQLAGGAAAGASAASAWAAFKRANAQPADAPRSADVAGNDMLGDHEPGAQRPREGDA